MDETDSKSHVVTFEEIMFTLTSASQAVFRDYMEVELLSGKVDNRIPSVNMDIIAVVGISGNRVGYIMIGSDKGSAARITKKMLMDDDIDASAIRDAFGELANTIAGAFKTKYHGQYGAVALGLPIVVNGRVQLSEPKQPNRTETATLRVQQQGAIIPFQSADGSIKIKVMYYM